ncbi:DUF2628 domain-containing protein [Candidatus Paracaedibacter symbiosus]|uniref:DUF2628 domain-containing protein n=1 Tax=Candidatus Paracaedibacter symbiosus TaxID=244582 RepID=UPI000509B0BA|nr:DUF2628 domain-containing protein [Candidatus Paracaedibacter symbiosus]
MALFPSKAEYLNLKEEDLEIYFRKNARSYIRYWKFVTNQKQSGRKFGITAHWPAFFIGFVWFFYRKLYLESLVIIVGILSLGFLFDFLFPAQHFPYSAFTLTLATLAKPLALRRAYKKIMRINSLNLDENQRKKQFENLGSLSYLGLVIGLSIQVVSVIISLL